MTATQAKSKDGWYVVFATGVWSGPRAKKREAVNDMNETNKYGVVEFGEVLVVKTARIKNGVEVEEIISAKPA